MVPHENERGEKIYSSEWFLTINSNVRPKGNNQIKKSVSEELTHAIESTLQNPYHVLTAVDDKGKPFSLLKDEADALNDIEVYKNKLQGMVEVGRGKRGGAVHYHALWKVEHTGKVRLYREQHRKLKMPRGLKERLMQNLAIFTANGEPPSKTNPTAGGIKGLYVNIEYVKSPQRAIEAYIMKTLSGTQAVSTARSDAVNATNAIVRQNVAKIENSGGRDAYERLVGTVRDAIGNDHDFADLVENFRTFGVVDDE